MKIQFDKFKRLIDLLTKHEAFIAKYSNIIDEEFLIGELVFILDYIEDEIRLEMGWEERDMNDCCDDVIICFLVVNYDRYDTIRELYNEFIKFASS